MKERPRARLRDGGVRRSWGSRRVPMRRLLCRRLDFQVDSSWPLIRFGTARTTGRTGCGALTALSLMPYIATMIARSFFSVALGLALVTGCGGAGTQAHQANMAKVVAKPPSFQVATPVPATLYLVLDPNKVSDAYHLTSERRNFTLDISEFRLFVSRDLKGVMQPQFAKVEVVGPNDPRPNLPHVVADVNIDNLELKDEALEGAVKIVSTRLVMTWAFAIRTNDAQEYLFSFAGIASSTDTSNGTEDFVRQTVESAISGLLEKWGEGDVRQQLLTWSGDAKGTE
jgi:hypothetical protein